MSGLKKLKDRIKSIKSTKKVTKTMQMISASKLQKLKHLLLKNGEYINVFKEIMSDIAKMNFDEKSFTNGYQNFFSKSENVGTDLVLMVVFTSTRGLCGGANSSVMKYVMGDIEKFCKSGQKVDLLVIGKKGFTTLNRYHPNMIEEDVPAPSDYSEFTVQKLTDKTLGVFKENLSCSCYLYYNSFKNAMTQIVTKKKILPVSVADNLRNKDHPFCKYEYESINIKNIIELYIRAKIGDALLQNNMSEEGARMTAMDSATTNANELVESLTLKLNRSRQDKVTTELNEVISGVEMM